MDRPVNVGNGTPAGSNTPQNGPSELLTSVECREVEPSGEKVGTTLLQSVRHAAPSLALLAAGFLGSSDIITSRVGGGIRH